MRIAPLLLTLAMSFTPADRLRAEPVADFYRGRSVTLIAGFAAGGGYDANVRVLGRHIGRFIPGQPAVVVSNQPGAGSLLAANSVYRSAPADGTVLAMFSSSSTVEPFLGNKAALFDPQQFSWVGSMSSDVAYCGIWQTAGVPKSFEDMRSTETIFGGGGTSAITYQHPMVLKNVLGAKLRVVNGYVGTRDVYIAMNRGEVNGSCGLFTSSIQSQWADDVKSGRLRLVIQMGATKSDTFGNIPSVYDFANSDEQRAILDVHFKQLLLARPLAGPPGIPAERLAALRNAFFKTLSDPDFLSDAGRSGVEISPVRPTEISDLLHQFAAFPQAVKMKAVEAIGR